MSDPVPIEKRNLAALDLLRFGCAVTVVCYHFFCGNIHGLRLPALLAFSCVRLDIAYWSPGGWGSFGVEIFFVISGYVIARSARGLAPGAFLTRRLLRLVPAVWICASVSAAALLAAGVYAPATVLMRWFDAVLFLAWLPQVDPSYWTLGIEVNFYLLTAWCIRPRAFLSLERLPGVLCCGSLAYWIGSWLITGSLATAPGVMGNLTLLPHGCFFAVGMLLERRTSEARYIAPGLIACVLEILSHAMVQADRMNLPFDPVMPLVLFAAGLAVVAGAGRVRIGARWTRVTAVLGLTTYPLYLLHQEAGTVIAGVLVRSGIGLVPALLAVMVSMIALATLIAIRCEPQARTWLATYLTRLKNPGSKGDNPWPPEARFS